jgi:hypothetical protein
MIDKVIILSKKINTISEQAENLYYRLNVCTDDFGHYHADPEIIKGQIYTKRKISLAAIKKRLNELWLIGLIEFYSVNGETYLEIVGFEGHQEFRSDVKRKSEYPVPKGFLQRPRNESDTERNESGRIRCSKISKDKISKDKLIEAMICQEPKKDLRSCPATIRLILDEEPKRWEGITEELKTLWAKTYPGCDINIVLQEMIAYWDAQPKSKRKLNWKRTIVNRLKWLQDHGGTRDKIIGGVREWLAKEKEKEKTE